MLSIIRAASKRVVHRRELGRCMTTGNGDGSSRRIEGRIVAESEYQVVLCHPSFTIKVKSNILLLSPLASLSPSPVLNSEPTKQKPRLTATLVSRIFSTLTLDLTKHLQSGKSYKIPHLGAFKYNPVREEIVFRPSKHLQEEMKKDEGEFEYR